MEFNKCAFCSKSYNDDGKLKCSFKWCQKSQADIYEMVEKVFENMKGK